MSTIQLENRQSGIKGLCQWAVAILFATLFLSVAQRPARAQEVYTGVPSVASNRATINFKALADFQAQYKATHPEATRPQRPMPFKRVFDKPGGGEGGGAGGGSATVQRETSVEASTAAVTREAATVQLAAPSPPPVASFPALDDNITTIPPDTMGAVGPNHVMTTLNSQIRIQDRQGNVLSTMDLDTFWAPLGFPIAFDPHVVYDPYEKRWYFSAGADAPQFTFFSLSRILLAVSATDDPTGQWNLYSAYADINFFGLIGFGSVWADYPTLGFNKKWIVISANMFTTDFFQSLAGVQIWAFDKANVLTNGLGFNTLLHINTDPLTGLSRGFTMVPSVTYDRYAEDIHLVDIDGYGNNFVNSRLRLSKISGDVGREILTLGTSFTTNVVNWAPIDFGFAFEGFAEQAGSIFRIDTGDARVQNVVYRNGSLWCTHTVFLPTAFPTRSAVQWWQIGPTPTNAITYQFGRIEETNRYYAYPSIAVNRCNDALIGYSSFSSNQFASANYSFRLSSDPPGELRSPTLLKPGEAPYFKTYSGFENRWGDYSATVVDPVNDIDMWTLQEYAATPAFVFGTNSLDRWGTWWGKVDVLSLTQCGQVEFAQNAYTVTEGPLTAVITVTNITGTAGTVQYTTSDGTATSGNDYVGTTGTLTFTNGQKVATFEVTILDDGLLNSNRTVNLTLYNASGGVSLGGLTNATLTIIDDEFVPLPNIAGEFNFSTYFDTNQLPSFLSTWFGPSYFVTDWETDGPHYCGTRTIISPERRSPGALVTIMRTGEARGRVMVDFQTADGGTAVPYRDYMPTNMTLIFDDFQTSTQVVVRVASSLLFIPSGDKSVRLVLSNPRPAPEEEAERPGVIRPTLGPGAASQITIVEITFGDRFFLGGGFFGIPYNSISNYIPAFCFERYNFRVDEYPDDRATDVSGGIREIPVDVVFPFPIAPRQGGRCIFRTDDRRIAGVRTVPPINEAGSDRAESFSPVNANTFSGFTVFPNPTFVDPTLNTITNYSDYEGVEVTLDFDSRTCRRTVILLVTNDATVEFNEDIVCRLFGIVGEQYFPHFWADQCTVTILYHDQPAGAVDREWNPDNVAMSTPDPDFNKTPGANDTVYAVAVQPDGKTVLAGDFTAVNAFPRRRVARMNFDGSVDLNFSPGDGADGAVTGMTLYPTNNTNFGKILICGTFRSFDSALHSGITRLLPNGQVDPKFNPGRGADGPVWSLALQADGKIIVAGDFFQFNNVDRRRIARLHPDGAIDLSFDANPGPDFTVSSIATVPNILGPEKILIGGNFFTVNGEFNFGIAQLNPDGSLDAGFNAGSGANGPVYSVLVQTNGGILVAGAFTQINDTPRVKIARLLPDGKLDPTFDPAYGANDSIYTMTLEPSGKIFIGGLFTEYNRTRRMAMARLRTDGTLDTSFLDTAYNQFAGFTHPVSFAPPSFVNSIALQPDGNVMVGGSFTNVGGNPAARHALRNPYTVFTRADKRNRFNIARLLGGSTPGPGNAEFDNDNYFVDENAGEVAIRMQRTDGRLGTLLGAGVTQDRVATRDVDYLNSTNTSAWLEQILRDDFPGRLIPWSVGRVAPVYFRIPILDDLLEEGDELVDLTFLRANGSLNLNGELISMGGALGRSKSVLDIIDNDFPKGEFNFLLSNYVTNESAIVATITVIRTNGFHGDVSVDYFTRNSPITPSATAGVDYQVTSGTLRFPPGVTTNAFPVRIIPDNNVELDENIQLVLTNAIGGARLPGGLKTSITTATLTIVDDDFQPGRLNFASSTYTNFENEGVAVIRVTRTGGSIGTVSVQYRTLDGTATSPADYTSTSGTLTWNNGDVTDRYIQVPLQTDGLVEGFETVRLQLFDPRNGPASEPLVLGVRTDTTLYIADSDQFGTLSFNQPYYQADENGGMASVTVIRTDGSAGTISVSYAAMGDSAVPGLDFTPVSGVLTFAPGQSSANFLVPLLDDTQSDGSKVVRLQLSNPVGAVLGPLDTVSLTLIDNESYASSPGENDSTFEQTAGANGPVYAVNLYLTNGILDGRIMLAGDFTNVNNIRRQGIARLHSDASLDTTFDIGIGPNGPIRAMITQADGRVVIGGAFTTVTATNRSGIARLNIEGSLDRFFNPGAGADGPVYALGLQSDQKILAAGAFSTFNDQPRPRIVRLNTNGVVDTTFNAGAGPDGTVYALAVQPDGKILVGGDFIQVNGFTRRGLARLNRNGTVDTSFNTGTGFDSAVRAVLIQPDGKIVVGGSFISVNGTNRNFLARVNANGSLDTTFLSGVSGANNTVHTLGLQVDGKIMVGGDFTDFNGVTRNRLTRLNTDGTTDPTINFGSGANSFVASLVIQPDRHVIFGGGFTTYDDLPRKRIARIFGGSIAGPGSIEFSVQPFVTDENATNAVVVVRRRGGTTGAVGVDFRTQDDTAIAGRDYLSTNLTLAFPQGEAIKNVFIRILDNLSPNPDRSLNLLLNNFTGGAIFGSRPSSSLIILNDEPTVGFSVTNFVTGEGDPSGLAVITVSRTLSATNTPFTVGFGIAGGSATPFQDYMPTNGILTFNKGDMAKNFHIPIINDTNVEGPEFLNLFLQNPSSKAFLGIDRATLTILDNDFAPGQLFLTASNYIVDEAAGFVDIAIRRTNGLTGFITVDIGTIDGTATGGQDYIRTNATIAFGDGELVKVFRVPILVDFLSEPSETFNVTLSRPTGGAVLVPFTSAIVTILNNDRPYGTFQFDSGTRSVVEGNVILPVTVYRVNGSVSNATVNFNTTAVSATANQDFRLTNGTLFFGPGVTNQTINIQILEDSVQEGTETFNVTLSGPSFGTGLGSPANTQVQIIDNDSPIIIPAGAYLTSETTTNNVIDSGERVTLSLGLKNVGFVNTTNLVATIQTSGGVGSPSPTSASYGVLVPNGPAKFTNFTFTANVTNNGTLTVTLQLREGGRDLGTATYTFRVGSSTYTFANPGPITILDDTNSVPYPSTIQVSDLVGTISSVNVTVYNMSHTYPEDIDLLLVSPDGTSLMLMSDAGGNNPIQNLTIRYIDTAPSAPPDEGQLFSGDCLVSNYMDPGGADYFTPPAPEGPYTNKNFGVFNGKNPNGAWSLYVYDDQPSDAGQIAGGWSISISVAEPVNTAPIVMNCMGVQANGAFKLSVRGQPGLRYTLQASSNLSQYTALQTFIMPSSGVYEYTDSSPGTTRFYRAIKGP